MRKVQQVLGVVVVVAVLLLISGCGKVTKGNYDKIQNGMTLAQVEAILGKGTEKAGVAGAVGKLTGSAKVMTWGDEKKSITITFVDDKVVAKEEHGL
ncbi:MAG TPA: DUF3862 domain-containing protein [Phycisphaerae bacterium]|nr:DUF3862 domain-containing protein [Phycisphaerae bacterium]